MKNKGAIFDLAAASREFEEVCRASEAWVAAFRWGSLPASPRSPGRKPIYATEIVKFVNLIHGGASPADARRAVLLQVADIKRRQNVARCLRRWRPR
jgi:hypothetical protein